jgi:hypothetical protein
MARINGYHGTEDNNIWRNTDDGNAIWKNSGEDNAIRQLALIPKLDIPGRHFRYGYFADCHIGHHKFREDLWDKMIKLFREESVDFIVDAGDHLEGMSPVPDYVGELTLDGVGYYNQMGKALRLYQQLPAKTFGIDGNHDMWYSHPRNTGKIVGEALEAEVENYTNLGQMDGWLEPAPGIILRLLHMPDGSRAYTDSYLARKVFTSPAGREKPAIAQFGCGNGNSRYANGIHLLNSGSLCGQTNYMEKRGICVHVGFGIADVFLTPYKTIDMLSNRFVPGY